MLLLLSRLPRPSSCLPILFIGLGACEPGVQPARRPQRLRGRKKLRCGPAMSIGPLRRHRLPAKGPNLPPPQPSVCWYEL